MAESVETVRQLKRRLQDLVQHAPQEGQVLKIINRLSVVPMTLDILQETRIGKDVNALRKWEGKIGERAKKLVKKWKELLPAGSSSALHQTSSGSPQSETQGSSSDCAGSWQTGKQQSDSHVHANEQWTDSDAFSDALGEEIQLYHTPPTKHHRQKKHKSKHVHKTESSKSVPTRDTLSIPEHDTFSDVLSQDFPSYLPGHSSGQRQQPSVERPPTRPVQTNSASKSKRVLENHESGINDIHSIGTVMRPEGAQPLAVAPQSTSKKRKANVDLSDVVALSKKSRTQVYSGSSRKTAGPQVVPSLFDLSMRVLIDNIDAIEEVGDVPYFILEPMLQKCSATQLMRLEEYNPHLQEDCGALWEKHFRKEFKQVPSLNGRTWKELYIDKLDEREQRLKKLTATIVANEKAKKEPVRTAKLAAPTHAPRHGRHKAMPISGKPSFMLGRGRYTKGLEKQACSTNMSPLMKQTMKMAQERKRMMKARPGK